MYANAPEGYIAGHPLGQMYAETWSNANRPAMFLLLLDGSILRTIMQKVAKIVSETLQKVVILSLKMLQKVVI